MNLFGTGGTDLALNLHARSKSAVQGGACSPVIADGVTVRDVMF